MADERGTVITITPEAHARLVELRDEEPEGDRLGLRLEVAGEQAGDYLYDLSFEVVTQAALTDVIRAHDGLKVIIPALSEAKLEGATLDLSDGGLVLRNPNKPATVRLEGLTTEGDLVDRVRAVLVGEVNPALAAHDGFVELAGVDGGAVYLTMGGGCHGCSMSRMTMIQGVQRALQDAIPEVERVVDVTDHATGENPYFAA